MHYVPFFQPGLKPNPDRVSDRVVIQVCAAFWRAALSRVNKIFAHPPTGLRIKLVIENLR